MNQAAPNCRRTVGDTVQAEVNDIIATCDVQSTTHHEPRTTASLRRYYGACCLPSCLLSFLPVYRPVARTLFFLPHSLGEIHDDTMPNDARIVFRRSRRRTELGRCIAAHRGRGTHIA